MSKKNLERLAIINKMRLEGKTLQEIGEMFGITRERVRQILMDDTLDKTNDKD